MMKRKILILIGTLVLFWLLSHLFNHYFTKGMIIGTYANKNYFHNAGGDMPKVPDTLQLFENGEFTSKYFGKGTYEISYSHKGTSIDIKYNDEFGRAGFSTYITRIWYGKPKIIMFLDLGHYYEKIE